MSRPQISSRHHKQPRLRFTDSAALTSFAGLVVVQALFGVLDFSERLRRSLRRSTGGRYKLWRMVKLLVVHLMLGWTRLRHIDHYRKDPMVLRVLGLRRLPDVSTVSRTWANADDHDCEALRGLNRELVEDRLRSLHPKELTLDFDGTVQSTRAHAEGSAVGFNKRKKGARSYYPLLVTSAITSQIYDVLHRPGNAHDSRGAADFALSSFERLSEVCPRSKMGARIDSAHFNEDMLRGLHQAGVRFTCSVPWRRFPVLKAIAAAADGWEACEQRGVSVKEIDFKPKRWDRGWRTLVVRQLRRKPVKGPIQLELFEPVSRVFEYSVIVTNRRHSASNVVSYHHGRGSQEKLFGEAKEHAGLGIVMGRRRAANEMFTVCAMMAHNLGREWQMRSLKRRRDQGPGQRSAWRFDSLGTLSRKVLHRAGRLIRPQGELTLEMNADEGVERELRQALDGLQAAA